MSIRLIAIGKKMPSWVTEGYLEYAKRFPSDCRLELVELPLEKRSKNTSTDKIKTKEGQAILDAIGPKGFVVALDVKGKQLGTEDLAKQITDWRSYGQTINLIIGGPDGISKECLDRADRKWSLSPLTLPHPLVRVIVAEQLYRAFSINAGHPYHK